MYEKKDIFKRKEITKKLHFEIFKKLQLGTENSSSQILPILLPNFGEIWLKIAKFDLQLKSKNSL